MGLVLSGLLVVVGTLVVPMTMSPLAYYAATGVALSVALAVLVWLVWAVAAMPVLPPVAREYVTPEPFGARWRTFFGECLFWACCGFYALVIAVVVAGIFLLVWLALAH